ncbi:unnamed protein product (mitochondrion) [Plasmodiophora brassicae]|uniref:RNA helicase n=1 Tax=Plasmodiophora brassicae TaxID=37360 RepID=A0A0G4J042_PLABS|nr:hypothetical protein PBRA_001753 [Plasmodiophora brassicae]SPQ93818.1 unnamed protein product [Plasmodiophora brassicae]
MEVHALADAFEALVYQPAQRGTAGDERNVIRRPQRPPLQQITNLAPTASTFKMWPLSKPSPVPTPMTPTGMSPNALPMNLPALKIEGVKVESRSQSRSGVAPFERSGMGLTQHNRQNLPPRATDPIQLAALSAIQQGGNVVVCTQNEKVAVSSLLTPILQRLVNQRNAFERPAQQTYYQRRTAGPADYMNSTGTISQRTRMSKVASPSVLILAPTKEVAERLFEDTNRKTRRAGCSAVLIRGAEDSRPQLQALQRGCDVLVATTGRLMDFLERGYIALGDVAVLILWEAGHMSNIGLQLKLRRIVSFEGMIDGKHQTLAYTKAFPRRLESFCDSLLNDYVYIAADTTVSCIGISQTVEFVRDDLHRRRALLTVYRKLKPGSRTLVFVATKRTADTLCKWLQEQGVDVAGLHGGRLQEDRDLALSIFLDGKLPMLVATDVASHVFEQFSKVDLVVNFDMPTNIDSYVRRTRLAAGGSAHALLGESCIPLLPALAKVLDQCGQAAPRWFHEMAAQAQADSPATPTLEDPGHHSCPGF